MRKIADSLIFDIIPKVNKAGYNTVEAENKKVEDQLGKVGAAYKGVTKAQIESAKAAGVYKGKLLEVDKAAGVYLNKAGKIVDAKGKFIKGANGATRANNKFFKSFKIGTPSALSSIGSLITKLGALVAVYAGFGQIKAGIELASDVEENNNKISAVFRETEGTIRKTISNISSDLKIGQVQIERDVSNVGAVLAGLGFGSDKLTKNTENVLRAAYDAASFHNLDFQRSIGAIQSAMLGESEALKGATGIIVQENQMAEYSKTLGIVWKDLNNASKAQLRLNFIMESLQKQGAAGDYEKTAQSYANLSKAISTTTEDIKAGFFATLQQELIPGLISLQNYLLTNKESFIAMGAGAGNVIGYFKQFMEFISPITSAVGELAVTMFDLGKAFAMSFDSESLNVFASGFITFMSTAINNVNNLLKALEPVVRLLGGVLGGVAKVTGKALEVTGNLFGGKYDGSGSTEYNTINSGVIPQVNNNTNSTSSNNTSNITINAPVNDNNLNRIMERKAQEAVSEWEQNMLANDLL